MAAIMPQILSQMTNRFPLTMSNIKLAMQNNTESNLLSQQNRYSPEGMSPLSGISTISSTKDHPDNLDHLETPQKRISMPSTMDNGNESDSDVSVGQENDDRTSVSDEPLNVNENGSVKDSYSPDSVRTSSKRDSVDFSEETSNDSSRYASQLCSPQPRGGTDDETLRVPTILRPSPTRLHEEFIRNSQLYAEELMRQQMSIVAAAQAGIAPPFSTTAQLSKLVTARTLLEEKMGFRPHIRPGPMPESLNFRGIHNHLNAISQITANLGHDNKLVSPSLTSLSSDVSQSPPIPNNHHHHTLHAAMQFMNNNHEPKVKFSIDNILKADFGRRITEPLSKRSHNKSSGKRSANNKHNNVQSPVPSISPHGSIGDRSEAMDLTGSLDERDMTKSTSPPVSTSSSSGNNNNNQVSSTSSTSGTNGEKGPIVWPAWVYCTRYSDRPSSGKYSNIFFLNFVKENMLKVNEINNFFSVEN